MSEWKDVPGFPLYEASNHGAIRKKETKQELRQWVSDQGYMKCRTSKPRMVVSSHRMVASTFLDKPLGCDVVNHIDGDRKNNNIANLEWCTQKHNLSEARKIGKMYSHPKGKRSPNAKIPIETANAIRHAYASGGLSWSDLAAAFKCSKRTIGNILKMKYYQIICEAQA